MFNSGKMKNSLTLRTLPSLRRTRLSFHYLGGTRKVDAIPTSMKVQYIYLATRLLVTLQLWYILFLPGWSVVRAEIEYTMHFALPKQPINQFQFSKVGNIY